MAKRRKVTRKRKKTGLAGLPASMKVTGMTRPQLVGIGLSALAGTVAGIAMGSPTGLIGSVGIGGVGLWKKNPYLMAAGVGMLVAGGIKFKAASGTAGLEGDLEGFSLDAAKLRVGNYFQNFKESLKLSGGAINGLAGDDEVDYFVNPYNSLSGSSELDLSQLDRINDQVAEMNGLADYDGIERNF